MPSLPLVFSNEFVGAYERLPDEHLGPVNALLDDLEETHDQPHMRQVILVGSQTLFATRRVRVTDREFRVTWVYDERDDPRAINCLTLAEV